MGFFVIIPLAALAIWSIMKIFLRIRRARYGPEWRKAFALLGLAGIALGVWFGFFIRYQIANTRLEGFPIPVGISSRERPDAPWVKAAMPALVRAAGIMTNLLAGIALCLVPIAVAAFFKENRASQNPPKSPRS